MGNISFIVFSQISDYFERNILFNVKKNENKKI